MGGCFDVRSNISVSALVVKITRMDLWVDALMPEVKSVLVVKVTRMDLWMGVAMLEVNN